MMVSAWMSVPAWMSAPMFCREINGKFVSCTAPTGVVAWNARRGMKRVAGSEPRETFNET